MVTVRVIIIKCLSRAQFFHSQIEKSTTWQKQDIKYFPKFMSVVGALSNTWLVIQELSCHIHA